MTVMSEGLPLNSNREEGGFLSFPRTATPFNCWHELIIWQLSIYGSAMV